MPFQDSRFAFLLTLLLLTLTGCAHRSDAEHQPADAVPSTRRWSFAIRAEAGPCSTPSLPRSWGFWPRSSCAGGLSKAEVDDVTLVAIPPGAQG